MNIFPYNPGSKSAKELSAALGIKRIKKEGSKFKGAKHKLVINWGCGALPEEIGKCTVLNSPVAVSKASNKLSAFKAMAEAGVRIPRFTENAGEVMDMLDQGKVVVARTVLNGHSGAGIVVLEGEDADVVKAPLYVEYVPKKQEYRIHVCNGEVVDIQRKARNKEVADENVNWKIRNHANGFIFARGEEALGEVPADVTEQAVNAVKALGLDFGAADVIFNDKQQQAYVLEVNTAPGLSGATLEGYVKRFREIGYGN
jgi:glutathione synthase/RimK-type ligase-like ATP-grasp enzyme